MAATQASVLVVDDEQEICELLYDVLSGAGYSCITACSGQDALTKLEHEDFNVVLLDIKLPDLSGMDILNRINVTRQDTAAIMITGIDSLTQAVEAMKCGASDYIVKPFRIAKINDSIHSVLENKRISRRIPSSGNSYAEDKLPDNSSYREIDAIANGVQARRELFSGQSLIITHETAQIARQLGFPENVIENWVEARSRLDLQNRISIKHSLDKLDKSLQAQDLLGLIRPYTPKNHKSEN